MEDFGGFLNGSMAIKLVDGASQVLEECVEAGAKTVGALKQSLAEKYSVPLSVLKLYIRGSSGMRKKELSDDSTTLETEVVRLQSYEKVFERGETVFLGADARYSWKAWKFASNLDQRDLAAYPEILRRGTVGKVAGMEKRNNGEEVLSVVFKENDGSEQTWYFKPDLQDRLLKPCTLELTRMQADTIADRVSALIRADVQNLLNEKHSMIKEKDTKIAELVSEGKGKDEEIKDKDEEIKELKRKLSDLKEMSDAFVAKRQALANSTKEYARDLDEIQQCIAKAAT